MRARAYHCRWSNVGPPNFRCIPFARDALLDPGRMAVPRISALLMLRSTISTVSAPATCLFRGSITNPTQLLCTLRGRRYRRLTQHLLPGGPLRPYPDRSCTGWIAPAFVGAYRVPDKQTLFTRGIRAKTTATIFSDGGGPCSSIVCCRKLWR